MASDAAWSHYGGDAGGTRYSAATQITPANAARLVPAWTFSTGDLARRDAATLRRSAMQVTPVLADGRLVVCTPFNEVIALDPNSGRELWRFDPKIRTEGVFPANKFNCRGVAIWHDGTANPIAACRSRVLAATNDARLLALDLRDGSPCTGFGVDGQVPIDPGMELLWPGEFQVTSAPVVVGDVVVVGSSIGDNMRVAAPRGTVRAYDVRSGAPKWSWDPVPRDATDPAAATWGNGYRDAGHANVWAPMSVDEARGLVFLPTSSPSPDFYGGLRPGDNRHANSVVALDGATGQLRWAFQLVHHDVWDYDTPAQPTLATIDAGGARRDVVIQPTKQGFIFVLDRESGAPVFPVEERAVPQGGVPGEVLSPTQPVPTHVAPLVPHRIAAHEAFGLTPWDRAACREQLASARSEGLYTPPSEQGTLLFPMTGGGINWGGISWDPVRQRLYANTTRAVHRVRLIPAAQIDAFKARHPKKEVSPQRGAPYGVTREVVLSPLGLPCNPPPWGVLAAVDLRSGRIEWESTLGTTEELAPLGIALGLGTPTLGGSLVTAGGVVFIGAAMDKYLRAFDAATGAELWQGRLPATGFATPMTYEWQGRQFVVIAAGGHAQLGTEPGDSIVAFALPRPGDESAAPWSRWLDRPGARASVKLALLAAGMVSLAVAFRRWRGSIRKRPPAQPHQAAP